MRVGDDDEIFMVDTGAEYAVAAQPIAPPAGGEADIVSVMGVSVKYPFLASRMCSLRGHNVEHKFLYMPECPIQLLSRDFLSKLQAQIMFLPGGHSRLDLPESGSSTRQHNSATSDLQPSKIALVMLREEEWRSIPPTPVAPDPLVLLLGSPGVWAEDSPPGLAVNIPPVYVDLKPGAVPVALRPYHIPQKAKQNIQTHLQRLKDHGILKFCVSPWNTPLLPGISPSARFKSSQLSNRKFAPRCPQPVQFTGGYTRKTEYYTVLDLKDAFFCIHLTP
uniref:Peptidase A2 domain-containing protein n=1 Tax=Leptobrachium leishanense TaxID=445787 RepID=A0A8C5PUS1_9ANUR